MVSPELHTANPHVRRSEPLVFYPLLVAIFFVTMCTTTRAEQLPIKVYTTSDGLPRNGINRIVRDSHGFLWFCTVEGLSRFDGYTFTNYGVEQGMPDRDVRDFIETRSGEYWIATNNGLARFNPDASLDSSARDQKMIGKRPTPEPRFVTYSTNWSPEARHVMALIEDRDGTICCGTDAGLCQLTKAGGQWKIRAVDLGAPVSAKANAVTVLVQDKNDALWIGTWDGLYR